MERMTDIWTGLVLVSAAATTVVWIVLAANVRFPALRARLSCDGERRPDLHAVATIPSFPAGERGKFAFKS